jgi:hypothetical protein
MKSTRLSFSPARALTILGLIYPMSSQVWQLLPCCDKDSKEPELTSEEDAFVPIDHLQRLVKNWIQAVEQLQRKRRRTARAYVRLRREHAHVKAQRALRWRLRRICRRQEEVCMNNRAYPEKQRWNELKPSLRHHA